MDYIPNTDLVVPTEFWRDDLDDREVMVTIRCITYNHEKYIRDALESFVNQKTNFRFEAIVHDDCSTDGTAAIIREYAEKYPSIIKPIFEKENQYSKHNDSLSRVMNAHIRGKYVAMCEGDDYWTDPLKLQKQVDFMEANPDYVGSYTRTRHLIDKNGIFTTPDKSYRPSGDILKHLVSIGNCIPTLTFLYKADTYKKIPKLYLSRHFKMGDYPLFIELSSIGKIGFLDETTSVYRVLESSASHSKEGDKRLDFLFNIFEVQKFYSEYYSIPLKKEKLTHFCQMCLRSCLKYRNKKQSKRFFSLYKESTSYINLKILFYYILNQLFSK